MAGAASPAVHRHGHRRDPRPLLSGQRGRLDPGAGPGARHALRRELLFVARAETGAAGKEEKADARRRQTLERELEWIRMSPKGRHAKGKARLTRYEQL